MAIVNLGQPTVLALINNYELRATITAVGIAKEAVTIAISGIECRVHAAIGNDLGPAASDGKAHGKRRKETTIY